MKKIAKIILIVFISFLNIQNLFSDEPEVLNGDFGICKKDGYNIFVKIEAVSVPFEGITSPKTNYQYPVNRVGVVQNGAYWRFFSNTNSLPHAQRNIAYITGEDLNGGGTDPFLDFGHCSGCEYPQNNIYVTWGFARYKITIVAQEVSVPQNIYTFKFYLNSLDSKYGDIYHGGYADDLYINFEPINEENVPRINFNKNTSHQVIGYVHTTDILNGEPTKEYKVWEVVPTTPVTPTKNFYAKSTPFPICPRLINSNHVRVLELGTDVTLNGVNSYTGEYDRNGYNTIDSLNDWSYNYYSAPPIPSGTNVQGKTYVTPATYYKDEYENKIYGFRLNVKNENKMTINNDHRLWISGYYNIGNTSYHGDTICFSPGSNLVMESNAQLNTCRDGKIIDSNAIITWNPNAFMHIYPNSEIAYWLNNNVINNGGHIEVDENGTFKVNDNSTVTFSGANTYLKLNPNAKVKLGENAKIEFKDGAYLIADQIAFSAIDVSKPATGLYFENTIGLTSITNCTFTNCHIPINIKNNQSNAGVNKVITNNTFTLPGSSSDRCILAENVFSLDVQNNTFNLGTSGIGIFVKNYYNSSNMQGEGNSNVYNLNIRYNTFNYGTISMILASYATALTPYVVDGNNFNNNSYISLLGRMMSGPVKNNTVSGVLSRAFHFYQSDVDLYNNAVNSKKNILAGNMSVVNLSPSRTEEGLVWVASRNSMTANGEDNIEYNDGNVNLDNGFNSFFRSANCYHLYGNMYTYGNEYYVRNNCFNYSNNPVSYLLNRNGQLVNIIHQQSTYDCSIYPLSPISWVVRDIGYGHFDSIAVTSAPSLPQVTPEELLLSQASINFGTGNYFEAQNNYKTFINNYPESQNTVDCLYNLYVCIEGLDTIGTQASKDIIYGNLLSYLNSKISSGLYSNDFNDVAYNLTLNCSAQIQDYNAACDGFEFLALYHPNPEVRLLASWDYAEVQALLGTGGAISSKEEKMTDKEFLKYRIDRMNKIMKGDPIKEKMKKTYSAASKKKENNTNKKFANLPKEDAYKKVIQIKAEETKLINKAVNNLRTIKTYTPAEKNRKQLEDLLLSAGISDLNDRYRNTENIIPTNYDLSQNYPNPFNPVTNIKYQLPKDGFVTLKVYDITGREIAKLVNETKQAGSYIVSFNGSRLSSGIYFYRIQAGDFMQVKKMVLVK